MVICLRPFLNFHTVVGMITFVPKLQCDVPTAVLLAQSQLPISCENPVSKGAKQSN